MKTIQAKAIDPRAHIQHLYAMAALLVICAIALVSCTPQQLGFVKPETVEDKIYSAYSVVGARYRSIADQAQRKVITREEGKRMIARADDAKDLVDQAAGFLTIGNTETAERSLEFATMILVALEKELKERGSGS